MLSFKTLQCGRNNCKLHQQIIPGYDNVHKAQKISIISITTNQILYRTTLYKSVLWKGNEAIVNSILPAINCALYQVLSINQV